MATASSAAYRRSTRVAKVLMRNAELLPPSKKVRKGNLIQSYLSIIHLDVESQLSANKAYALYLVKASDCTLSNQHKKD